MLAALTQTTTAVEEQPNPHASDQTDAFSLYLPAIFLPAIFANWEQVKFAGENMTDIKISESPKRIFVSAYNLGLFESQNNGESWKKHNVHARINSIELHQTSTDTIYLATWSTFGVYQTQDGGVIWKPTNGWRTLSPTLYKIAIHPTADTVMFAGSGNWEFSGGEIYKTKDAGNFWYPVSPPYTNALTFAFAPSNADIMFAGTQLAGIMKSVDGGESWMSANNGLPMGINGAENISSLVFHPDHHRWMYAASSLGVFVSYDLAGRWEPLWADVHAYAVFIDPQNDGNMYVGTDEGIFLSHDDGATWSQLGRCGMNTVINRLVIDPTDSDVIWVGTDDGMWRCSF